MKIGLLGGAGQLGSELTRVAVARGHEVIAPTSSDVDICHQGMVQQWVSATAADCWINCAAYTAVDAAEADSKTAQAINADGAANLAHALNRLGTDAPAYYFSTDYVFDGNRGLPYTEEDTTNPQSVYGRTKLAGEIASLTYSQASVLRISWVFGVHGHNFVKAILRAARGFASNGGALKVVDDQFGAPCGTRSIASTLLDMHAAGVGPGVYHFSTQPYIHWHDFACAIVEDAVATGLLSKPVEALRQPTSALNQAAKRPPDGRLDSHKLQAILGTPAPAWRDDLRAMLEELKEQEQLNPGILDA